MLLFLLLMHQPTGRIHSLAYSNIFHIQTVTRHDHVLAASSVPDVYSTRVHFDGRVVDEQACSFRQLFGLVQSCCTTPHNFMHCCCFIIPQVWKLRVLTVLALSFFLGSLASYWATSSVGHYAIMFNAILFFLLGVVYMGFVSIKNNVSLWQAICGNVSCSS